MSGSLKLSTKIGYFFVGVGLVNVAAYNPYKAYLERTES